jgi:predicted Zn-dependent peptidase
LSAGGVPRIVKADRSRLPEPGPQAPFEFPAVTKSRLPNGLEVWSVRHAQVPIVALILLLKLGAADDPTGKEGLAALTADMLDEGIRGMSAIALHEALARIGAQFDTDIGPDATIVSVTALSRFTDGSLRLLGEMVARPTLAEGDFSRVRQLRLHRLKQLRDVPAAVADRAFARLLYGDHPYGHTPIGSEPSLAAASLDDVREFHRRRYGPSAATLVAVGDCDHETLTRLAGDVFGDWSPQPRVERVPGSALPEAARLNVVPRPGAPQSEVRMGHVAVSRATPDYHALVAANMVLGGQFVSRINLNLRGDKGFTYGARTAFDFRRLPGPFALQVSVQTSATARTIEESIGEIVGIRGPRPVSEEELSVGVAALTRGYARAFETAEQIARAVTQLALYELPDDFYERFVPLIKRVTPDEVTRVMQRHLHPERLMTLFVGDLDAVGPSLPSLGLGDPVVVPDGF